MTTTAAIGAWDDGRVLPMLRDYLARSAPRKPVLSDNHLRMFRETDLGKFSEMVTLANRFNGRH